MSVTPTLPVRSVCTRGRSSTLAIYFPSRSLKLGLDNQHGLATHNVHMTGTSNTDRVVCICACAYIQYGAFVLPDRRRAVDE